MAEIGRLRGAELPTITITNTNNSNHVNNTKQKENNYQNQQNFVRFNHQKFPTDTKGFPKGRHYRKSPSSSSNTTNTPTPTPSDQSSLSSTPTLSQSNYIRAQKPLVRIDFRTPTPSSATPTVQSLENLTPSPLSFLSQSPLDLTSSLRSYTNSPSPFEPRQSGVSIHDSRHSSVPIHERRQSVPRRQISPPPVTLTPVNTPNINACISEEETSLGSAISCNNTISTSYRTSNMSYQPTSILRKRADTQSLVMTNNNRMRITNNSGSNSRLNNDTNNTRRSYNNLNDSNVSNNPTGISPRKLTRQNSGSGNLKNQNFPSSNYISNRNSNKFPINSRSYINDEKCNGDGQFVNVNTSGYASSGTGSITVESGDDDDLLRSALRRNLLDEENCIREETNSYKNIIHNGRTTPMKDLQSNKPYSTRTLPNSKKQSEQPVLNNPYAVSKSTISSSVGASSYASNPNLAREREPNLGGSDYLPERSCSRLSNKQRPTLQRSDTAPNELVLEDNIMKVNMIYSLYNCSVMPQKPFICLK